MRMRTSAFILFGVAGLAGGSGGQVGPRDGGTRLALAVRLVAGAFALIVAEIRFGVVVTALIFLGGMGLVAVAWRRKAAVVPGAVWTVSADVLVRGKRFPGQLSVLNDAIVWLPSKYSSRRGVEKIRIGPSATARVNGGPALGDVYVSVTSPDGAVVRFLTRRSPRLAEAVQQFGRQDPHRRAS